MNGKPAALLFLVASMALAANTAPPRSIGSLQGKPVVDTTRPVQVAPERVREAYRRFLAQSGGDPKMRAEALRRLADLELEAADSQRADGATADAGSVETRAAIQLYEELRQLEPDHPRMDSVLYQLGRSYEAEANVELALQRLDSLVARFPASRHIDEAQFRRGEILFSAQRWPKAEEAYAAVIGFGDKTPFYEQALYKHGWALFKQSRTEDSAVSLFKLLDRKLLDKSGREIRDETALPRADRELVLDAERALGIQFSAEGPAESLNAAVDRHARPQWRWRLYTSLGDLLIEKERYTDAADVFRAYAATASDDLRAPVLQTRAIEAYLKGGFAELALAGKREFVERYGLRSSFWSIHVPATQPEIVGQVKSHLLDLARNSHALAQANKRPTDYGDAARWYREYLESFPNESDARETRNLLADVLFESGAFADAAIEYQRTAYDYPASEDSAKAGYASLVSRERHEQQLQGAAREDWRREGIDHNLQFINTFAEHPESGRIALRTARQQIELQRHAEAVASAERAVSHRPELSADELRAAYSMIADASFELGDHLKAEAAYRQTLARMAGNAADRAAVSERLAASIYRQGEASQQQGDLDAAVENFLRIAREVPGAEVAVPAQHDAANLLLQAKQWTRAIPILVALRRDHASHPLSAGITRNLAVAFLESGDMQSAAIEFSRVAEDAAEPAAVRRAALLQAAELQERGGDSAAAIASWTRFVERYPTPFDEVMAARQKIADLAGARGDAGLRSRWLVAIVAADKGAGTDRNLQSRTLAARASLELAAPLRTAFEILPLKNPLQKSLKAKRDAMEAALKAYREAADYGIGGVTSSATHATADMYRRLAADLMASERPRNLKGEELEQYALLLEEQAYPFEERAIELHEANVARVASGTYDEGVRNSFSALAELKPARYRKSERLPGLGLDPTLDAALGLLAQGEWTGVETALSALAPSAARSTILGVARRQSGRFAEAEQAYREAASLNEFDPTPSLNLGVLFDVYLNQPDAALAEFERAQSLMPGADAELANWLTEVRRRATPAPVAAPPPEVVEEAVPTTVEEAP